MFELLQTVRIRRDSPEHGLATGMVGAVVDLLQGDGEAYEVDVVNDSGRPLFLGALPADLLEPMPDEAEPA